MTDRPWPQGWQDLLDDGHDLIASGDIDLSFYRNAGCPDSITDGALTIGIMLQPDDFGPADAISRATIMHQFKLGTISEAEAYAALGRLDEAFDTKIEDI